MPEHDAAQLTSSHVCSERPCLGSESIVSIRLSCDLLSVRDPNKAVSVSGHLFTDMGSGRCLFHLSPNLVGAACCDSWTAVRFTPSDVRMGESNVCSRFHGIGRPMSLVLIDRTAPFVVTHTDVIRTVETAVALLEEGIPVFGAVGYQFPPDIPCLSGTDIHRYTIIP